MALTNGEQLMVDMMKRIGLTMHEAVGTMLLLRTKEERTQFLLWMYRNRKTASPQDALRVSVTIHKKQEQGLPEEADF